MALTLKEVNGTLEYVDEQGKPCTVNGELIGGASPEYSLATMFSDFYDTPLGERFLEEFGIDTRNPLTGETNAKAVERVFTKLHFRDPRPTLSRIADIADAVQTAISAGELTAISKPVAAARPRDPATGKFQNPLLAEYYEMLCDPNVAASQISQRMKIDRPFREAIESEGQPLQPSVVADVSEAERVKLQEFAAAYTAAHSLKPIAGYVDLLSRKWSVKEFTRMVDRAIETGILR